MCLILEMTLTPHYEHKRRMRRRVLTGSFRFRFHRFESERVFVCFPIARTCHAAVHQPPSIKTRAFVCFLCKLFESLYKNESQMLLGRVPKNGTYLTASGLHSSRFYKTLADCFCARLVSVLSPNTDVIRHRSGSSVTVTPPL